MLKKQEKPNWTASNILDEVTFKQKHLTSLYNSAANEAANANLRTDFINIQMEEHELQTEILRIMERRGLYQPNTAEGQDVLNIQEKYDQPQRQME